MPLPAGWTGASPRGDRLGDGCEGRTPQQPSVAGVPRAPAGWTQDSERQRQSGRAGDAQEGGALHPTEPPTFRAPHGSPPLQESPRGRLHCPGQDRPPATPPRIHTPPSAGQGQTPAGLRVQAGTAGGARSQENCRDAEVQGGQRGCLKTHRSPGPQGSARRELAAPGQRPSQRPPTSSLDGSGHSADRCSQGRRTAPGSDPRWAGREAKHAGPALDSLRLVNKPHLTLETLTRGWDPPRQPTEAQQPHGAGEPWAETSCPRPTVPGRQGADWPCRKALARGAGGEGHKGSKPESGRGC